MDTFSNVPGNPSCGRLPEQSVLGKTEIPSPRSYRLSGKIPWNFLISRIDVYQSADIDLSSQLEGESQRKREAHEDTEDGGGRLAAVAVSSRKATAGLRGGSDGAGKK